VKNWLDKLVFSGTSTQKGQLKPALEAKDGQQDTMHKILRYSMLSYITMCSKNTPVVYKCNNWLKTDLFNYYVSAFNNTEKQD